MHEYDNALKTLLQRPASRTLEALAGGAVERWLNVEQPKAPALRVDLLGEMAGGGLLHIEFQSTNDRAMPCG